ncbi:MAG: phenylalanine--tRNA ligase subunit beta, partial [Pseudomonadota bacterium]
GAEYFGPEPGEQRDVAAILRVGQSGPREWTGSRRPVDLYDAKADAEAVLAALGAPVDRLQIFRDAPDWFHPGRSGVLKLGPKNPLAAFGELHPNVLKAMDVKGPAVAVTVFLENPPFPKAKAKTRPALATSDYQMVERDFAFVVDADVEAEAIVRAAKGADKALIDAVAVFDIFAGDKAEAQMGAGKKSVAFSVRLQPKSGTLTDEEIETVAAKVVAAVAKASGGELRG